MSTPDGRPLTRRQLRELRQTGQNAIIADDENGTPEEGAADEHTPADLSDAPAEADGVAESPESDAGEPEEDAPEHESSDAEEATGDEGGLPGGDEPIPDDVVTLEAVDEPETREDEPPSSPSEHHPPLTRRQLREQERQRTGVAPVIVPPPSDGRSDDGVADAVEATIVTDEVPHAAPVPETVEAEVVPDAPATGPENASQDEEPVDQAVDAPSGMRTADAAPPRLRPGFGENVAVKPVPPAPASFDELLTHPRESSGSGSAPSALILDEIPSAALNAPITATGELIVTSSHKLPDGFGSSGAAKGTTDGREIDAVLIDGEIPLASSPTPIAASDAVSTSKSPGEVIRPPAPEKNHKLVLTLGITAGALGIAVVGAVVIAYASGVFG
ncbi:hypothetical protein N8K70_08075 [Microbacterium betulae]|uniref:Uncharacterized protein n=1 Tax=Microbacterium betulae TaxID=2981139 RepID=A0AA97FKE2_9MICO|nr:hypothetical protein [Microbacterium sp. AB]WOF24598.1 hypothetical protein N8K70_08075 [Microbacterium sp. AB]